MSTDSAPTGAHDLFRREALAERQAQWLGRVLLAPRPSQRLFVLATLSVMCALGAFLYLGEYSRKARLAGWLVPEGGLVRVFAPLPGVVKELYVEEGQRVQAGQRLLLLSDEVETSLGATRREVARRLAARRENLLRERARLEALARQRASSLERRLDALGLELDEMLREQGLQLERLRLAEEAEARQREMCAQGLIPALQLQSAQEARVEQALRLNGLLRQRAATDRERITLQGELSELPLRTRGEVATLERDIATLEQELAEAEARREALVTAPQAGTVTALQAVRGGAPTPGLPLLCILPADAPLEAQMFAPSRAVGLLQRGQRVLLRYQAYPHQRFGLQEGVIREISRTAINPGELPGQLAGLTSLFGAGEPVYRITIGLRRQSILADRREVPLQPGMQLEADVLLETRRLYEWVLAPVFGLGRD